MIDLIAMINVLHSDIRAP